MGDTARNNIEKSFFSKKQKQHILGNATASPSLLMHATWLVSGVTAALNNQHVWQEFSAVPQGNSKQGSRREGDVSCRLPGLTPPFTI